MFQLKKKAKKIVSFVIENLFPFIDVIEIIQTVNEEIGKMYQDKEIKQTLEKVNNLIINENYFQFNNTIYEQKEGVLM